MPPLRSCLVALLTACGLALGVLVPVAPAAAAPATPDFPRAIDAYARYEEESGCDPTAKRGALEVQRIIRAAYGPDSAMNTPRACSPANSGHEEGRAIDWMTNVRVPAQRAQADDLIMWLLSPDAYGNPHAMARRLGVSYVIWNSQKFYLFKPSAGWTEYSDCLRVRTGPENDNTCHRNHVHISLSWAGARAETSWYTGQGQSRSTCPAAPASGAAPAVPTRGLGYVPVTPARLLDTRGQYVYPEGCRLGQSSTLDVGVLGTGGVPTSGVAAVALNLTGVGPSGTTWISAYPTGSPFPGTSSVNVPGGRDAAALVVVPVGAGGKVSLRNGPFPTDVVVDVVGYYPADGGGTRFTAAPATRVLDAVVGKGFTPFASVAPAGTVGLVANVVMDNPAAPGYAAVVPRSTAGVPTTSSLNVVPGATMANRVFTQSDGGSASLYTSAQTRAVVDVVGWLGPQGAAFYPLTPARVVDSRTGTGVSRLQGGSDVVLELTGRGGVPAGATSVAVTVTMTDVSQPTHLTLWQPGTARPASSDLNVAPDAPRANLVIAAVDYAGQATLRLDQGSGDVVVDVLGYYR